MRRYRNSRCSRRKRSERARSRARCSPAMPRLRELQRAFFRALASGAAGENVADPALLGCIHGAGPLDAPARVEVYAQMYWMRIADALREDFPRTVALVGDEA